MESLEFGGSFLELNTAFISVASVAASQPHNARDPYPRTPRPSSERQPAAERPVQPMSISLPPELRPPASPQQHSAALGTKPDRGDETPTRS